MSDNQSQSQASPANKQRISSNVPDAMNQTIFELLTKNNQQTHEQISSLYTQTQLRRPQHRLQPQSYSPQSAFTGIPRNFSQNCPAYMAYPIPWRAVAGPDQPEPDFSWLSDSCAGKAIVGTIGGASVGLIMGVFLGAMSDMTPPVTVLNGKEVPQAPLREQMKTTLRATGEKSLYWARNFAFITGVFGGSDCLVEKWRGKHDVWNEVISGCVTGAAMQAKQGPQAAAIGCGGFAAFSLIIDKVMH